MASGIALFLLSLLTWFESGGTSRNGWSGPFSALGVFLSTLMLLQLSLARNPNIKLPAPPVPWGQVHAVLGGVSLALILLQFLVSGGVAFGAFLGLLAAAGLAYGGFRAYRDQ